MELKRREKRKLQVGDYCRVNKSLFHKDFYEETDGWSSNHLSTNRHDRMKALKILDVSIFVVVESIFGGGKKALIPAKTSYYDYNGKSLLKFLKTKKFFYIDDKYLDLVNKEDAMKEIKGVQHPTISETIIKLSRDPFIVVE